MSWISKGIIPEHVEASPKSKSQIIRVSRELRVPDPIRVARYSRCPEVGPRLVFFTGGSAIRELTKQLTMLTHNSVHIVTPFDSGGSSAKIRKTFNMIAVGDIRNRILALADHTVLGSDAVHQLFSRRLPKTDVAAAQEEFETIISGNHDSILAVDQPMRSIIQSHLRHFQQYATEEFDLKGASIGNLVLTGGFLNGHRDIDSVTFIFSRIIKARGIVIPASEEDIHLGFEMQDGSVIYGQHKVTGKEEALIQSSIQRMFLCKGNVYQDESLMSEVEGTPLQPKVRKHILDAEVLVFPMGSFYSSILCNLLVPGMASAIVESECPKCFIPNSDCSDPEMLGLCLCDCVELLLQYLRVDGSQPPKRCLNFIIVDSVNGLYPTKRGRSIDEELQGIKDIGISVIDVPLASADHLLDPKKLAHVLASLV